MKKRDSEHKVIKCVTFGKGGAWRCSAGRTTSIRARIGKSDADLRERWSMTVDVGHWTVMRSVPDLYRQRLARHLCTGDL
jgi:hypothetical protein